jgi:serine/threonine-protein kinase RsbT
MATDNGEIRVAIAADADLVTARAEGRALAQRLGFTRPDPTLIATAISELARNIVMHVGHGEITMRPLYEDRRYGLVVIVRDEGQGIPDVEAALRDGYASRGRPRASASRAPGGSWTSSRSRPSSAGGPP